MVVQIDPIGKADSTTSGAKESLLRENTRFSLQATSYFGSDSPER